MITDKPITPKQLVKIHALLKQAGKAEYKRELILEVTNYRTASSKELLYTEVIQLINYLEGISGLDKLRRKVFALAYDAGIIYGDSPEDKRMNTAKLNQFLVDRGTIKKELNQMTKPELLKTVNQFVAISKHIKQSNHDKEVKSLLNELNLNVK